MLLLIGRLALGGIFLFAAYAKMRPLAGMPWTIGSIKVSLAMFAMGVHSYPMLPAWAVSPVAHFLPPFELVLGVRLVSGIALRLSSLISTLAICTFITAMASAYARGLSINCGCFGQSSKPVGPKEMMVDGLIFLPLCLALLIGSFMIHRRSRAGSCAESTPVPQLSR